MLISRMNAIAFILFFSSIAITDSFTVVSSSVWYTHSLANKSIVATTTKQQCNKDRQDVFALSAKSGNKKKRATRNTIGNRKQSSSGFGGAATSPCPCGSGKGYMKCCGKIHKDANAYATATPEQVVRARYSAYAKREVDFIVGSTHPLNKDFMIDIEHWKETIRVNCYDNFELNSCQIVEENFIGEGEKQISTVKFIATMTQVDSREKTAFMETSTFERAGKNIRQGAWMYKSGVVEPVPGMTEVEEETANTENTNITK